MAESAGRKPEPNQDIAEKITSLAKRRGFVFPSSEIYGGAGATWDFGPLGVELKNNVKRSWWRSMVQLREDIVGLDGAILMHPKVWEASGHVENFTDPLVECRNCRKRFRLDDLPKGDDLAAAWRARKLDLSVVSCPSCGEKKLADPRQFNLMFKTFVGPVEDTASVAWLRPETAQSIFVDFENIQQTSRKRLPFGIAQIGKAFRNEITPGNFIFRSREFEQMELQYFTRPSEAPRFYDEWKQTRLAWHIEQGIPQEKLRFRDHADDERAHYAAAATDIQFAFPFGWNEFEGIHYRTDYDLRRHSEFSGKKLEYFDDVANERYIPHVVETSVGADRTTYAILCAAYDEEPDKEGTRVVLRFRPHLAPYKVAVLPLSKNEKLTPLAREVWSKIRPHVMSTYDETQNIGRRYRRQDEIGTPLCVTVDFESLEDQQVTIRERDSMAQVRVAIPISCRPSARSSAPDLQSAVQSALTLYLFTTGTRTPLLALLALRRPRNLVPILLSYAGLGLVALVVRDPVVAILALSPSPLIGPALARFVAARTETVGALLTGTLVLSFPLLMANIPGLGPHVTISLFAFVIGTALAGAVPTLRDVVLPMVDGARYVAVTIILGAAALAALSFIDPRAVGIAALVLLVGAASAAIGAILFGGDGLAAAIGAGTRDPAVAAGLAIVSGLAGAAAVPLAYAALLALSLGVGKLVVARQA